MCRKNNAVEMKRFEHKTDTCNRLNCPENDRAISFLHVLFNVCFKKSFIPSDRGKDIIDPIPKSIPWIPETRFLIAALH